MGFLKVVSVPVIGSWIHKPAHISQSSQYIKGDKTSYSLFSGWADVTEAKVFICFAFIDMSELYNSRFQAVVLKTRIVWTKSKQLEDEIVTVEFYMFFVRRSQTFPILLSASYFSFGAIRLFRFYSLPHTFRSAQSDFSDLTLCLIFFVRRSQTFPMLLSASYFSFGAIRIFRRYPLPHTFRSAQ
jgi:hypothetical protein